jgi:hypothetical protein
MLTELVGAAAVVVGPAMASSQWPGFGILFGVVTALGLVALALVPRLAADRGDQILLGGVGAVALLESVPSAIGYFSRDAALATGLAIWFVGAIVLFLGARRLVRLPVVVEAAGAAALIGGAALTGIQATGFATLFGIATAVGLIALGMLPGRVLLSVFGSLGLLIFVPWAIGWFFPGENIAPVLILVAGALILGVAVLLTRMGGRFRKELGGPKPAAPRPGPTAPGPTAGRRGGPGRDTHGPGAKPPPVAVGGV